MRGDVERQVPMLTLTTPDQRVPKDHHFTVDGSLIEACV